MSHRYQCGPSIGYLKEGVGGNGGGHVTNACVLGILTDDKKKQIESTKQLSCNREERIVSWNRE